MAQLDDIVGAVLKKLKDDGARRQHHRRLQHRQRRRELHLARRRPDAVRRRQGDRARGRLPRALHRALAGEDPGRQGRERDHVRARLVPDLPGRWPATRPSSRQLKKGKKLGETGPTRSTSTATTRSISDRQGAPSKRNEIFYFAETKLGAVRIGDYKYRFIDQPAGWLGGTVKVDWPLLTQHPARSVRAHRRAKNCRGLSISWPGRAGERTPLDVRYAIIVGCALAGALGTSCGDIGVIPPTAGRARAEATAGVVVAAPETPAARRVRARPARRGRQQRARAAAGGAGGLPEAPAARRGRGRPARAAVGEAGAAPETVAVGVAGAAPETRVARRARALRARAAAGGGRPVAASS